jgi:hypothetical protein
MKGEPIFLDDLLEEVLEESVPGSNPVGINMT